MPVMPVRRGTLVTPAEAQWIIQRAMADPTSESLQVLEGHACHARRIGMDHQTSFSGPDKQVPPKRRHRCKFPVRAWPRETKAHA
jgi:hypothetical protein